MEGTPYCRESTPVMSSSVIKPILVRQLPSLPPLARWHSRAFWSWSFVIRHSLTSISPRRTDIRSTPSKGLHPSLTLTKDGEKRSQNFICRFEMANTVRTGRFFQAGTGRNLDLLPQDAILPEEMREGTFGTDFMSCRLANLSWRARKARECRSQHQIPVFPCAL